MNSFLHSGNDCVMFPSFLYLFLFYYGFCIKSISFLNKCNLTRYLCFFSFKVIIIKRLAQKYCKYDYFYDYGQDKDFLIENKNYRTKCSSLGGKKCFGIALVLHLFSTSQKYSNKMQTWRVRMSSKPFFLVYRMKAVRSKGSNSSLYIGNVCVVFPCFINLFLFY